jgi:hypothetical protein
MKNERKKPIFLRYELFKMFNGGYTQEQMQEFIKTAFEDEKLSIDEIIDALVTSRFNELVLTRKIDAVTEALKS